MNPGQSVGGLKPQQHRIIIEVPERPEKTSSGLFLPGNVQDDGMTPLYGIVQAIGPGRYLPNGDFIEVDLFVGNSVLFAPWAMRKFKPRNYQGTSTFYFGTEDDVFAVDTEPVN